MYRIVSCLALVSLPAFAQQQGWSFVQSVGGIKLEAPKKVAGAWALPVSVNVSGLKATALQPTVLNSGLACEATHAVVEGTSIYIGIVTGIAGPGKSAACPSAKLGTLAPGQYTVFYRGASEGPVHVGEVAIGL
jgi:hypothetical protein